MSMPMPPPSPGIPSLTTCTQYQTTPLPSSLTFRDPHHQMLLAATTTDATKSNQTTQCSHLPLSPAKLPYFIMSLRRLTTKRANIALPSSTADVVSNSSSRRSSAGHVRTNLNVFRKLSTCISISAILRQSMAACFNYCHRRIAPTRACQLPRTHKNDLHQDGENRLFSLMRMISACYETTARFPSLQSYKFFIQFSHPKRR